MKFDDMSRDELLKYAKEITASADRQANHPPIRNCPFCYGTTVVPAIKCEVNENLISRWHEDVTHDQYQAWWKERTAKLNEAK